MYCTIQDIPVYYEQYGEGKPVLCIHGYWVDHRLMSGCIEPVFENIKGYKRIYLDLPGMGKSKSSNSVHNSDDMIEIVKAFIHKIIKDESFLLIGESYGGYLSMGLIYEMPDLIDGVMLICPLVTHERENLPEKQIIWQDKALIEEDDADLKSFLDMAVIATPEIYNKYKNDILSGIKIADTEFLSNYFDGKFSDEYKKRVNSMIFNKPSCILTGRQDQVVGFFDAYKILGNFPRATFAILDCAGHNLQIDNEFLFNQLLMDWIWRVELVES
ncbi:alpha/beta fold hydrolase [Konateibacter massiliensis]|uniref:alpha/beta fold hydrolase n=1 Tax=Konateibacter massiliensis TaxID=2002841 RepID=UPI000C15BBD8|nr:alpha/beta hydrolase [Konateibacter massiliensis]